MADSETVLAPSSAAEATALFADGVGVTVVGGGTIVVPAARLGGRAPARALLLHRAGLAGVTTTGGRVTVGAATPLAALTDLAEPLASAVMHVGDIEIRGQATLGGNLYARNSDAPRGDLQAALIALGALVHSVGAGGSRTEPVEDFLPVREGRLVLDVSFAVPAAGAYACLDRPHAHDYTALAVSVARGADGGVRIGAHGAGPHGLRLRSAEAVASDPDAAGRAALADVALFDDALASAWYRGRTLPVLVRRALTALGGAA